MELGWGEAWSLPRQDVAEPSRLAESPLVLGLVVGAALLVLQVIIDLSLLLFIWVGVFKAGTATKLCHLTGSLKSIIEVTTNFNQIDPLKSRSRLAVV